VIELMVFNYRTYAVVGFGEATPPQALYFLVFVAGKAGHEHQKGMILGGPGYPLGAPPCLPLDG
jgi:hypothetical protein